MAAVLSWIKSTFVLLLLRFLVWSLFCGTLSFTCCGEALSYITVRSFSPKMLKLSTEEAVAQTCFVKKVFLEISQNSQENTCARVSFLIKLQAAPFTGSGWRIFLEEFNVVFGILSKMFACISIRVLIISLFVESSFCKMSNVLL